jgi:hypothetical protein
MKSPMQPSLFGGDDAIAFPDRQPLAATADPVTSFIAAADLTNSGRRRQQKLDVLKFLRVQTEPLTSAEIAAKSGLDRHLCARRLPDLEADKMVKRCAIRECSRTGRPCVTWACV